MSAPDRLSLAWSARAARPPWPQRPHPSTASIRELARAWLAYNDGVGLSIGIYANGQRQFYNFGTTRLDGNKTPTEEHDLRNRRHRQDHDRAVAGARHHRGARLAQRRSREISRRALSESRERRRARAAGAPGEHDFAAHRQHSGSHPGAHGARRAADQDAHARAREVHARGIPAAAAHASSRGARPAATRGTRTWPACCSAWCWRRSMASPSRPSWRAKSKSRCAWAAAPRRSTKLLARGYTTEDNEAAAILGADAVSRPARCATARRICCGMRPGSWWNAMRR